LGAIFVKVENGAWTWMDFPETARKTLDKDLTTGITHVSRERVWGG
jgi:hypothetical protein